MNKLQELNKWFKESINDIKYNDEPQEKLMGKLKFSVVGDEMENYLIISLINESVYNLYSFQIDSENTEIKDHLVRALRQAIGDINLNSMFGTELELIRKSFITYH